ncbi:MAG: outer membrane protein assembly factor BamD [Candidatus Dadabacteria bacterium]|nr:MAG: outer membrane protein assembly factor BamD [Candidatus Dadabacteria bacterium]
MLWKALILSALTGRAGSCYDDGSPTERNAVDALGAANCCAAAGRARTACVFQGRASRWCRHDRAANGGAAARALAVWPRGAGRPRDAAGRETAGAPGAGGATGRSAQPQRQAGVREPARGGNAVIFRRLCAAGLLVLATGCASTQRSDAAPSPERLFQEAEEAAQHGGPFGTRDCFTAEQKVTELRERFPYHAATIEGDLIIAECAWNDGRQAEATARWESFVRLYPDHRRAPEVWLRLARAYKEQFDDIDRDLGSAIQALNAANTLIRRFPESDEANEAVEVRKWAREQLAAHELYVARQYIREGSNLAARDRLTELVRLYTGTSAAETAQALLTDIESRLNFPETDAAEH